MKPDIDLKSPIFKGVRDWFLKESKKALEAPQTVENAIIPIYTIPKTKGHLKKKKKFEQIGSGILVKIKDSYFVFTAEHVFKDTGEYAIAIGAGDGSPIQQFNGNRYSSKNPNKTEKDIYDAAVYHIEENLPENFKNKCISLDQLDLNGYDSEKPIYLISGFRVKDSNTKGNSVSSKRKSFTSIEFAEEEYSSFKFPLESHIILAYEDQMLIDNNWKMTPRPRGMSGGGIIKVLGTTTSKVENNQMEFKQVLSAITIEQHREKHNQPSILIGTRLKVHLGLIYQFLPELLDEFFDSTRGK
jgi:hypothetical protein